MHQILFRLIFMSKIGVVLSFKTWINHTTMAAKGLKYFVVVNSKLYHRGTS